MYEPGGRNRQQSEHLNTGTLTVGLQTAKSILEAEKTKTMCEPGREVCVPRFSYRVATFPLLPVRHRFEKSEETSHRCGRRIDTDVSIRWRQVECTD
jgi:hypothetical protein